MAVAVTTIQIKYSTVTAQPTAASLLEGELAYSESSHGLWIGLASSGMECIAGPGVYAKLASPTFTGTPAAPTATAGTNTTQLATTAFVLGQSFITGNQSITLSGDVTGSGTTAITTTINAATWAKLASPAFTGNPTSTTTSTSDNSTNIATTAYVKAQNYITGNQSITLSGDISGSGTTAITATLASVVTAGTNPLITYNAKGLVTGGAALTSTNIPQTLTHAWITDFTSTVEGIPISSLATPTATINMNSQVLTGLTAPVNASDAATKAYVDGTAQGLDIKQSCQCATTSGGGNITLSGLQTIDGYTTLANDRVLVKNQTTGSANGIYVASSGAWARSADFATTPDITEGSFTFIDNGTINGATSWVLNTTGAITVGSTTLTFVQFSGAGLYTAGNGLTITGNQFSAVGVANQISVSGSGIGLSATYIGQTSITTLGTVTAGTWTAGTVGVGYGGTGLTSISSGGMYYASSANTLSVLPAGSGSQLLAMNSAGTAPNYVTGISDGTF